MYVYTFIHDSIRKTVMGEVFLGCVDKECKKPVAIKISNGSNRYEYKIGKRIEKLSGMRMYGYQECVNEKKKRYSIIYTEYANSGTLSTFIKNNISTLRPIHLRTIVTHIGIPLIVEKPKSFNDASIPIS